MEPEDAWLGQSDPTTSWRWLTTPSPPGEHWKRRSNVLHGEGIQIAQVLVLVDRSGGVLAQLMDRRNLALSAVLRPADLGVH